MAEEIKFEIIRGTFTSWASLFQQAADFATSVGKERVISISHSSDDTGGVVTVWYWATREKTNLLGIREDE